MKADEIKKVLVLGAGTMGGQIAWLCAAWGLTVSVYDVSAEALAALPAGLDKLASVPDIDRSWMGVSHMPAGPFGIMDSIGLGTVHPVCAYWAERSTDPQTQANTAFLGRMIGQGCLGIKNGRGFYSYPDPAFRRPEFLTAANNTANSRSMPGQSDKGEHP